jgi:hypothetical protein
MALVFHDCVIIVARHRRRDSGQSPVELSILLADGSAPWIGRSYARSTGR